MRTLDEVLKQLKLPWADLDYTVERVELEAMFRSMAEIIWSQTPDGPEKTLALRRLQEVQWYVVTALQLSEVEERVAPDN